ncbi:MAG: metallophosphoesterase [Deltaproteobacteria bacterium]|nr:metallophosphoesterase [Deltaproteobacteria bacterium]
MAARHKSVETRFLEERETVLRALQGLDRRSFLKVVAATAGAVMAKGLLPPHSFQLVTIASAAVDKGSSANGMSGQPPFTFAYISDTHLYERTLNQRFIRAAVRAVEDVNALDPQPDFVLFGGDLAQLGSAAQLELGQQILKDVKAPVKMMVGEHDWFLDMGDKWQDLFGPPTYSFNWKGVHVVVLMSVNEKDFWTARKMTPEQRMETVAGLDNSVQSRFEVGEKQREWLKNDLTKVPATTPVLVFSHSPLYKYYHDWNFWTDDAEQVQAILQPYAKVTVIHGHTHQMLFNQIGNISFYGMLSTAWPWPYAPSGLPRLTVQMNRGDPFDQYDACGTGHMDVLADGLVDKIYNLWDRNPVTVRASYLRSQGKVDRPPPPQFASY